ncbi:MAG: HAD family hydrolase [Actinomycetota bacterium]|nr:HAD family hydrolase [Actinomycetota bacterium]
MPPWDLVIFDNDGVLVDSERMANTILGDLLTGYGRPTTTDEAVERHLGTSLGRVRALLEAEGIVVPSDFEDAYDRRLFAAFDTSLVAVPGVAEVVGALDIPVCVASSGGHERIRRSLTLAGLAAGFEGRIFSAEDVSRGKPAPDLFLHAAAAMGARPGRCAVIEDSPLGVEAANAAGMTAFGYAAVTPAPRLSEASVVFSSMGELPRLLAAGPTGIWERGRR